MLGSMAPGRPAPAGGDDRSGQVIQRLKHLGGPEVSAEFPAFVAGTRRTGLA
jgi:hypothetical protein